MKKPPLWKKCSRVFHEQAREYDSWFDSNLLFEIEKSAIRELPIQPSTCRPSLEIGCGTGRFGEALQIEYGIDPATGPLQLARSRGMKCSNGIGEALPFTHDAFGSVYLLFTLCFLENPAQALIECRRVLKKDGMLIIGFIPASSSWGISLQKKKEEGNEFYKYCTFYGCSNVLEMLSMAGFEVLHSISSLFQSPDDLSQVEYGQPGLDTRAGFIALAAKAINS